MWIEIITKVVAEVIADLITNIVSRLLPKLRIKSSPASSTKEGKDLAQEGATSNDLGNSVAGYIIKSNTPTVQDNVDVSKWDKA